MMEMRPVEEERRKLEDEQVWTILTTNFEEGTSITPPPPLGRFSKLGYSAYPYQTSFRSLQPTRQFTEPTAAFTHTIQGLEALRCFECLRCRYCVPVRCGIRNNRAEITTPEIGRHSR